MPTVNMHDAKSGLSRLVADLESGAESEIIIARNGKPVARLIPFEATEPAPRAIGFADSDFEAAGGNWPQDDEAAQTALGEIMDARWDRFERQSRELENMARKSRKKSA